MTTCLGKSWPFGACLSSPFVSFLYVPLSIFVWRAGCRLDCINIWLLPIFLLDFTVSKVDGMIDSVKARLRFPFLYRTFIVSIYATQLLPVTLKGSF